MTEDLLGQATFFAFIFLFLWGLLIMLSHHNLIKKLMGMYLVQTSVILFFVSLSAKRGGTVAILLPDVTRPEAYANPLPPALMLTAIVVGVATLGVSLALAVRLYRQYGTLEEGEIFRRIE